MEFKSADDFIEEASKKPVLYHIYCYYDKKLERFNQPMISADAPEFIHEATVAQIKKGKIDTALCNDLILVHLGDFDLKTGDFTIFDKASVIVDCQQYLIREVSKDA